MGSEGIVEVMGGDSFFDADFTEGTLKGVGVGVGVKISAADDARCGIGREIWSGEKPETFAAGFG